VAITERARDLADPAFGQRAGHLIERVGIEHRVTATHKPKIAVEATVASPCHRSPALS
jgi:hypothetical protein